MSNQIVISSGAKVRNLDGVLTGSTGVVGSVPLGAANGVATLDSGGKVPVSQLPSSVVTYLGTWDAATNTPTLTNGTGDAGDMYICNVAGTVNFGAGPITFAVGDWVLYGSGTWQKSNGQNGTVTSVAVTESGDALSITGSPITTAGTINIGFAGNSGQYINGEGNLTTFPSLITEAQTLVTEVYNSTGATLTKGTIVYINGGQGNLPTVTKAIATSDATSAQTYGVVKSDITNNNNGYVIVIGSLGDLDTQAYSNGTQLYLSGTTEGAWTSTKPSAPIHLVYVGIVVRSHPTQGVVEIKIQNGYELDELHDVAISSVANNDGIFYNSSNDLWENKTIAEVLGYTPQAQLTLTTTGTSGAATLVGSTLNIPQYTDAYTGTVTSVAMTVPTGLSVSGSPITTSGTLAVSLASGYSIPTTAKQSNWDAAYDLRISSVLGPLTLETNSLGITQANTTTNGYLSSTDWNTFNGKQNALTLTTTGTSGAATLVGSTLNIPNYAPDLSGYVTLVTDQTISGAKTLTATLTINNSSTGSNQDNFRLYKRLVFNNSFNDVARGPNKITLYDIGDTTSNIYGIGINDSAMSFYSDENFEWYKPTSSTAFTKIMSLANTGVLTSNGFVKSGGTASQFLKANGTVDSTEYLPLGGGALTGSLTSSSNATFKLSDGFALRLDSSSSTEDNDLRFAKGGVDFGAVQTNATSGDFEFYVNTDGTLLGWVKMINILKNGTGTTFTGNISAGNLSGTNTGDQTLAGLGGVPTSRTLTINGTSYDLSADRSWTVTAGVSGSGTQNKLTKWNNAGGTTIGDSSILDTGASVTMTTTSVPLFIQNTTSNTYTDIGFINGDNSYSWYLGIGNQSETAFGVANKFFIYDGIADKMRMVINTSGNVGIGTSSPDSFYAKKLVVAAGSEDGITIFTTTGSNEQYLMWAKGTSTESDRYKGYIGYSHTDNYMRFGTNSNERARITSGGNVGIGTTSPTYKLVVSNGGAEGFEFIPAFGTNINVLQNYNRATSTWGTFDVRANDYVFRNQGTAALTIASTGAATFSSSVTINSKTILGSDGTIKWGNSSGDAGDLTWDNDRAIIVARSGKLLALGANGSQNMYISTSGNVLIGTSTDSGQKLQVVGGQFLMNGGAGPGSAIAYSSFNTITFTDDFSNDANGPNKIITYGRGTTWVSGIGVHNDTQAYYAGGTHKWYKFNGTTATLNLSLSGTGELTATGGFFDTSDSRLKTLITDNHKAKGIENVTAKLYVKNGKEELGYYAQDLQEVLPSAVTEGADGFLTLSYSQVHTAKIAQLEAEVAELKELIKKLL